jgi:LysM repeat protein
MPDYKPNPIVRVFAVVALIAALILVAVVIATSGGDSSKGTASKTETNKVSRAGHRALRRGVWIVHTGDTLARIAEETGIDVDVITQLNPDLDPQTLQQGQRIALR